MNAPGYQHSVEIKTSTILLKTVKCICCDEVIEDVQNWATRGEHEGEPLCDDCAYESMDVASAIRDSDYVYYCGEYTDTVYGEDEAISEYFSSLEWHSTDGWRGYYYGSAPTDYTRMVNSWFGTVDGYFPDSTVELFHDKYEAGEFDGLDFFIACPRTSNVLSSGIEVFVHNDSVEEFKNILKSSHTDES